MELSGVVECAADVGFIQVANLFWVGKLEVLRHLEITILGFGLNRGGYSACEACGLPRLATGGWPPHPGCSGRACSCRSLVLLGLHCRLRPPSSTSLPSGSRRPCSGGSPPLPRCAAGSPSRPGSVTRRQPTRPSGLHAKPASSANEAR